MIHHAIGERLFTDGQRRIVYVDDHGRQFVIDANGRCVYGVWLLTTEHDADIPVIVDTNT